MGKACSLLSGRDVAGALEDAVAQAVGGGNGPLTLNSAPEISQTPLQGRRRSLLIGCNYRNSANELHGCVNDVKRMLPVLESLGFTDGEQRLLLDEEGTSAARLPTKANMLEGIAWLAEGAQTGDALFLHYSGHGGRQPSGNGYHETLVPLDFEASGMILDSELFEHLVKTLPSGCRLTCLLDSCHSAGALNLPYLFVGSEQELARSLTGEAVQMVMSQNWSKDLQMTQDGNMKDVLMDVGSLGLDLWHKYQEFQAAKGGDGTGFRADEKENVGLAVGEVIAFTGCRSDQTSADVGDVSEEFHLQAVSKEDASRGEVLVNRKAGKAGGALTSSFIAHFQSGEKVTYAELLEKMRSELAQRGYSQVPQLASSLLVELRQPFALDTIFVPLDSGKNVNVTKFLDSFPTDQNVKGSA